MRSFAALALAGAASAVSLETYEFMQYVSKFGKNYDTLEEFNMRMELFTTIDKEIKEWNATEGITSTMGHNYLSDYTQEEKKALRGLAQSSEQHEATHFAPEGYVQALSTFNWCNTSNSTGQDQCSPIKNQEQCGSCWAFSATETVESAISIFHNVHPTPILSPQQLVSCSQAYGNNGCNGGWYYYAWNYLQANAQETNADYPYTSGNGVTGTCKANTSLGIVKTVAGAGKDYVVVGQTNTDIMSAIDRQPTSVAIDASQNVFQYYTSGVITTGCGTTLDHAVVAVGYGTSGSTNYFMVRNSWGTSWGMAGFVMIGQSSTGTAPGYCGINSKPYYPNIVYPL